MSLWAVVLTLFVGCEPWLAAETPPPLDHVPGPSQIQVVGPIVGESTRDQVTEFEIADGLVVSVDLSKKRQVVPPGGSPALLVVGVDDRGEWVAVIGHQDGTPEGCHVLNSVGYELGDSLAIAGVRWQKATDFTTPIPAPAVGRPYPDGTRFCLNGVAEVDRVLLR